MFSTLVLALVVSQAAPQKLRWEPRLDLPVTGVLAAGWIISETALKKPLAPAECRWCAPNAFDNAVRSVFNPTLAPSAGGVSSVDLASGLVGFVALPLAMLGLDALLSWRDGVFLEAFPIDALLMVEATVSAMALNQTVKFSVGRARPYTIERPAELVPTNPTDDNLSFFSGHSSFSFALAASAATIAGLRGYRYAWVLWAVGLPLAATTAILRLGADKHWASDVLIGGAIGTAIGILMPTLLHGRVGPVTAQLTAQADGVAVVGRF
jgi:membrane-associated phospholipid phosphatase